MLRTILAPLLIIAALIGAGQAAAQARPHPPTVTLSSCHVNDDAVTVCVERVVPVRWTHPGDVFVSLGTCKAPQPVVTVRRSGGHVTYTVARFDDELWLVTAHTVTKQYRLRPADGWLRVTRRTYVSHVNVSGPGCAPTPPQDPSASDPGGPTPLPPGSDCSQGAAIGAPVICLPPS